MATNRRKRIADVQGNGPDPARSREALTKEVRDLGKGGDGYT